MTAIDSTKGSSYVHGADHQFGPSASTMSPGEIIAFITKALGDIGDQLGDYKKLVEDRHKKATELRQVMSTMRDMATAGDATNYSAEKYNEMMTLMARHAKTDPEVKAAYEHFLGSYGGYTNNDSGLPEGVFAGQDGKNIFNTTEDEKNAKGPDGKPLVDTQDMCMSKAEMDNVMKNIENAQQNLNSDNELMMMNLQQLMQKRNQISQLGTNLLNTSNESLKAVIGNIGR